MRFVILMAIIIMLVTQPAFAQMGHDGTLPKTAYGSRVLSVGYRYNLKFKTTEIRMKVRYQGTYHLIYFTGEHLPMGAAMMGLVGKKINLATGENGNLFIVGYASTKYK